MAANMTDGDFATFTADRLAKSFDQGRDPEPARLLALAEVYDGGSVSDASRIGGVGPELGAALQRPRKDGLVEVTGRTTAEEARSPDAHLGGGLVRPKPGNRPHGVVGART